MTKNNPRWWALSPPDLNGPEEGDPLPECWSCESEYQYDREVEDDGMCPNCHEKNGEVFCGFCKRWAKPAEGVEDACSDCMNETHAEANHIDDERRRMEEL